MPKHGWARFPEGDTTTDLTWRCSACGVVLGFNRPGIGTLCATGDKIPENVDDYVGPCIEEAAAPQAAASVEAELKELRRRIEILENGRR